MFEFKTTDGRHFAGSVRDVSERHAVEKLKQEFVSTVSHELRTPLTSIRGSLSLLAGGVLGELSDEAREMVTLAERNCVRLIALVNDILDLERLEQRPAADGDRRPGDLGRRVAGRRTRCASSPRKGRSPSSSTPCPWPSRATPAASSRCW